MKSKLYIAAISLVFLAVEIFLLAGQRSTVSEQERRELTAFPEWDAESYANGEYTEQITRWFSDTVPMRDDLVNTAFGVREAQGIRDDEVTFHNVGSVIAEEEEAPAEETEEEAPEDPLDGEAFAVAQAESPEEEEEAQAEQAPHTNETIEEEFAPIDEAFNLSGNGIIVTGDAPTARAMMLYGGSAEVAEQYAQMVNRYKETMPDVNVYCMVIPTAVSFYCPAQAQQYTGSQLTQINRVTEALRDDVYGVNVYTTLGEHRDEPIYSRTDHHWSPRGAYYAAQEFARVAGVPFLDLSAYEEQYVHNYVGTMYMYSQDIRIKNSPEEFTYYVPTGVEWSTTYINYSLDGNGNVTGEQAPMQAAFFMKYPDGHSDAYCTFMGGDSKITQVVTDTDNGRRVLIIKDSFGNAIPGYLFGSFEQVHVIDVRYFTRNLVQYVRDNGITDILFADNAFHVCTPSVVRACERFLVQ